MISYNVPFLNHFFYQISIISYEISNNEKRCFYIVFFQCIKKQRCIAIFIATVKSKVEYFLLGILCKVGVIGSKLLNGSISYRTFSFFLETEFPSLRSLMK